MAKRTPEYDPQWVDLMIHLFSEATVQLGLGYAVGGRVRPGKVEMEDGQVHAQAQVRGTAPGLYQVSIWLDAEGTDPDTGYDSECPFHGGSCRSTSGGFSSRSAGGDCVGCVFR